MLKAIHAQESRAAADRKARAIVDDLRAAKMSTAADLVERSVSETLTYYAFPDIHWQKIRTTIDKRFFVNWATFTGPFFCSAAPQLILPSRPSISEPPRAGAVKTGRVCGRRKART
jgi:putative transposase